MMVLLIVFMAYTSLSGCATILTQGYADEMDERISKTGGSGEMPRVFSGTYLDLKSQPSLTAVLDLPLSVAADTVILPYTIATQIKYGNIGQRNIAAVPLDASLTDIRQTTLAGRHGNLVFLPPNSYEGGGIENREPNAEERNAIEIDLSNALNDVRNKFKRNARKHNRDINIRPINVSILSSSELEANACNPDDVNAVKISTGTLREAYKSVLQTGVGENDLRSILYLMYVNPEILSSSVVNALSPDSDGIPNPIIRAIDGHVIAQSYSSAIVFVLAHEAYHVWVDKCDDSLYGKESEVKADILGVIAMKQLLPDFQPGEGGTLSVRLREPLQKILERMYGNKPLFSRGDLFHMPLKERLELLEKLYSGDDAQALKQVWKEFLDRTKS